MWKRKSNSKLSNISCRGADGRTYHSGLEAAVNNLLLLRERAGELRIIKRQERVPLIVNGVKVCTWVPDFTVEMIAEAEERLIEAKGFTTQLFLLKKKIYMATGTRKVEMWGGSARAPKLMEILVPKEFA
jgi:hypothetical protein